MANRDDAQSALWFVAGVAVGATIALLFAPQSGEETRRLIGTKTREGRDKLSERGRELMDQGRELFDRGREIADEAAEMFERGRRLVQD